MTLRKSCKGRGRRKGAWKRAPSQESTGCFWSVSCVRRARLHSQSRLEPMSDVRTRHHMAQLGFHDMSGSDMDCGVAH
eukprot:229971-Rhodomonas_salina.2